MTTPGSPGDDFGGSRHVIDGVGVFCVDTAPAVSARPTVVAVHGIPESSVAWRDVAAVVGDSARMVIPDLPGFGRSDKPPVRLFARSTVAAAGGAAGACGAHGANTSGRP